MVPTRQKSSLVILSLSVIVLFPVCLAWGSVDIPLAEVFNSLSGGEVSKSTWRTIVIESRLPAACTAALSCAALSVAGLLLQTTFGNPLAGPSILGVSTGSSLGVAIVMLATGGAIGASIGLNIAVLTGAFAGAMAVMAVLLVFSSMVHSSTLLLIIGIMVNYLTSSAISLLNFMSTQEGVHSFVIWGLGNFSGVGLDRLPSMAVLTLAAILLSMLFIKPLNALLLGERYARSMGVNIRTTRNRLLTVSGVLTAIVTAYCGPIGFLGLIVPHIARLSTGTTNHSVLLPATALTGAAIGLFTLAVSVSPGSWGVIPVNAITPVIGVPIIIYIILNRKKIFYFN